MKTVLALFLLCALSPAALAQASLNFGNLLRSVTGAVSGDAPAPAQPTAALGIRGMDEDEAMAATPATEGVKLLESWAVGRTEAESAAARRGLVARKAEYKDAAPAASPSTPSSGAPL